MIILNTIIKYCFLFFLYTLLNVYNYAYSDNNKSSNKIPECYTKITEALNQPLEVECLNLSNDEIIISVPQEIEKFENLKELTLHSYYLIGNIDVISKLKKLEILDLSYNGLTEFPKAILELKQLKILDIGVNDIKVIPNEISILKNLEILALSRNFINTIPSSIIELKKLHTIAIGGNNQILLNPETIAIIKKTNIKTLWVGILEYNNEDLVRIYKGIKIERSIKTEGQIDYYPEDDKYKSFDEKFKESTELLKEIDDILNKNKILKVSLSDYINYETSKKISNIDEQIHFRVKFIGFLNRRIK